MKTIKIVLIAAVLFSINFSFNACGENQFGTVESSGVRKINDDRLIVDEEAIDTDEEIDKINENYGDGKGRGNDNDELENVVICHVPPGNPEARHTIRVGDSAILAHIEENHNRDEAEHKDHFGPCDGDDSDDTGNDIFL